MLSPSNQDNTAGQDTETVAAQQSAVFIVAVIIGYLFMYLF